MVKFTPRGASAWLMVSAIFAAGSVSAQPAAPPAPAGATQAPEIGASLQEVTVSASAITISGYDQPTPVTSLGLQQLQSAAQPDLTDSLRALPAFASSSSPENTVWESYVSNGAAGLDQLNLRNLGPNRTLVLIDGQRIVDGTLLGGTETSTIPSSLVERVDVVTGGASAIWGSGAVAGVVNYVLNHNFNGVQIDLESSNNDQSLHQQYRMDITVGTGFDDNRGHIEASASEWRIPNTYWTYQTEGYDFQYLVNNPACNLAVGKADPYTGLICPPGQTPLIHANNVGIASATPGGLITGCLNAAGGTMPCNLVNTYFVGPNATPMTFNPGNVSNGFFSNGGTLNTAESYLQPIGAPLKSDTAFFLGSFKFTDHVEATLQFDFGYTSFWQTSYSDVQYGNSYPAVIYSGNPYIPASVQSQMTAQGIGAINVGTTGTNPFNGPVPSIQAMLNSPGDFALFESRRLLRGVFGLDGDIGSNWTWKAYYERSETHQNESALNNNIFPAILNAENAVTVGNYTAQYTAANYPNPLGLTPGTVTCLSNLLPIGAAGETTNCAPLNIFGTGPGIASAAAIRYVNSPAQEGGDSDHVNLVQDVGAASVQGKLPIGLPAGPVAMAAGIGYRRETGLLVNCGLNCDQVNFYFGNFANFYGNYNVKEGSLELNAPLLKNQGVKDLSVDAAYRAVDYSTSGFVQTYKFGVVSQLTDAVRLRASYSRDIRAGNLEELFQSPQTIGNTVIDPRTGLTVPIYQVAEGNPNVKPEQAETRTAGFVLTPVQGLTASIDWYYIRIKNVIQSLGVQQVANLCQSGNSSYCNDLIFGQYPGGCSGPSLTSCPAGEPLAAVTTQYVNIAGEWTSGLDFLADYRMPFFAGALDFNTDENYTFALDYSYLGSTCDAENGLGADQYTYPACFGGAPKFRGTTAVSYAQGGWLGTVQVRMIGAAHLVTQWINTQEVDNNNIPFYTYLDLRLSYRFGNGIQLYGALDNVGDRIPPIIPASAYSGVTLYESPYDPSIYDAFGRVWRLGIRAKF